MLSGLKGLGKIAPGTLKNSLADMFVGGVAGVSGGAGGAVTDAVLRGERINGSELARHCVDFGIIGFGLAGMTHGFAYLGSGRSPMANKSWLRVGRSGATEQRFGTTARNETTGELHRSGRLLQSSETARSVTDLADFVRNKQRFQNLLPEFMIDSKRYRVNTEQVLLGRGSWANIDFLKESTIASRHAVVHFTDKGATITRLDRKGQIFVNGFEVKNEYPVKPGDRIQLGNREIVYRGKFEPYVPMEYKENFLGRNTVNDGEAIRQSIRYKDGGTIRERLVDGFQTLYGNSEATTKGLVLDLRHATIVVDRVQDSVLQKLIAEAHLRFDSKTHDSSLLAAELNRFAKERFQPKGWSEKTVDEDFYMHSGETPGKRILLGDYAKRAAKGEGAGVCQHEALLFKILGDEFGLDTSLVQGHFRLNSAPLKTIDLKYANHVWNTVHINGKDLIFDPRRQISGGAPDRQPRYVSFEDVEKPGQSRPLKYAKAGVQPGDSVTFCGHEGWTVSNETSKQPGNIVLRRDGTKRVSMDDFARDNPGMILIKDQQYRLDRNGKGKELGWIFEGESQDGTLNFFKRNSVAREVPADVIAKSHGRLEDFRREAVEKGDRVFYGDEAFEFVDCDTLTGKPIIYQKGRLRSSEDNVRVRSAEELSIGFRKLEFGDGERLLYLDSEGRTVYRAVKMPLDEEFFVYEDRQFIVYDEKIDAKKLQMVGR